jgi:hypothetical protein
VIVRNLKGAIAPSADRKANACQVSGPWAAGPLCLLLLLLCTPVLAIDVRQPAKPVTGDMGKAVESPIKYTSISYKSGNRRDPFLNPLQNKKQPKPDDEEITRGTPPPGIAGTLVEQALLQGTSIRNEGRIAIVRGADTRAYFIREGDRLFDGYVKTIENDSITLVRETKMRSGKILTQDVTKRLRTP